MRQPLSFPSLAPARFQTPSPPHATAEGGRIFACPTLKTPSPPIASPPIAPTPPSPPDPASPRARPAPLKTPASTALPPPPSPSSVSKESRRSPASRKTPWPSTSRHSCLAGSVLFPTPGVSRFLTVSASPVGRASWPAFLALLVGPVGGARHAAPGRGSSPPLASTTIRRHEVRAPDRGRRRGRRGIPLTRGPGQCLRCTGNRGVTHGIHNPSINSVVPHRSGGEPSDRRNPLQPQGAPEGPTRARE